MSPHDPATPPGCLDVEDLSAFVDGELAPAEARRVEAHAATCERCATLLARLGATSRVLSSLPRETASESLVREVARRAASESAAPARARRPWTTWAAAAVIVICCILVVRVVQEVPLGSPAPSSFPQAQQAPLPPPPATAAAPALEDATVFSERTTAASSVVAGALAAPDAGSLADADAGAGAGSLDRARTAGEPAQVPSARPRGPLENEANEADEADAGLDARRDGARDEAKLAAPATPGRLGGTLAVQGPKEAAAKDRAQAAVEEPAAAAAEEPAAAAAEQPAPSRSLERQAAPPTDDASLAKREPAGERDASAARAKAVAPAAESPASLAAASSSEAEPPTAVACGRERRAAEEQPIPEAAATEPPILRTRVDPAWPAGSPDAVSVEAVVEIDGTLTPCRFLAPVAPKVEAAVREALKSWRWRPARLAGRPQAVTVTLTLSRR